MTQTATLMKQLLFASLIAWHVIACSKTDQAPDPAKQDSDAPIKNGSDARVDANLLRDTRGGDPTDTLGVTDTRGATDVLGITDSPGLTDVLIMADANNNPITDSNANTASDTQTNLDPGTATDYSGPFPSFSGAEGFGAISIGGRGGKVYHVTNLNNAGAGSFRDAVEASGSRTVVFDVSGIILLTQGKPVQLDDSNITIAGQTAPGEGILIAGEGIEMVGGVSDVVIRYLRIRRSFDKVKWADWAKKGEHYSAGPQGQCLVGLDATRNLMIDHLSVSWGTDENMSIYRRNLNGSLLPTKNITIQWCLNAEALNAANHAFASTWGGQGANQHHNLLACNVGRNPSISFSHFMDYRNNVVFNWRDRTMDGAGEEAHLNVINNYLKPGPASGYDWQWNPLPELLVRIVKPEIRYWGADLGLPEKTRFAGPGVVGWWYINGNVVEGYPEVSKDNWGGEALISGKKYRGVQWDSQVQPYPGIGPAKGDSHPEWKGHSMAEHPEWARVDAPITHVECPEDPKDPEDGSNGKMFVMPNLPTIATQSTEDAYHSILAGAGATIPARDAVDLRVVEMVTTGKATSGPRKNGIIDHPDEVGGYPKIAEISRSADWDSDLDGMPNEWETARGLDPKKASDGNDDYDKDGYTNLEEYLNDIGAFKAVQPIFWRGNKSNRYAQIENWNIAFQPSRLDTAVISQATVQVDAIDQHAGVLRLTNNATLHIREGWLDVATRLEIEKGCTVVVNTAGKLIASEIVNLGTLRLMGDAGLVVNSQITGTGELDVSAWNGKLP